jgi:RNA-directed DNA polymerase
MPAAFMRMRLTAQQKPETIWNNLMHQMSEELLARAYHALEGGKARGVDGMSKARYGEELSSNLGRLTSQLHEGKWRPKPARRVWIPKADGKARPLAISSFEDKIVQKAVADILVAIYEPIFCGTSHGFRPKRGSHTAIKELYRWLADRIHSYVVDIDIEKFFDTIDHRRLMDILQKRISDRRFLRLIRKLLKSGVLETDEIKGTETGAPQGSIVSPILANIYLHEVIDQWAEERYGARRHKLVRYADDVVICFGGRNEAVECMDALEQRMGTYGLRLNRSKSRVVEFERGKNKVFHFLGFTWYWGKDRKRRAMLKLKTQTERFRKAIHSFSEWIKRDRNRYRLRVLWKKAGEKLRGHYAYYGVTLNNRLFGFYWAVVNVMFKWLNRRSQKRSFNWASFLNRLNLYPLPKPWGTTLINITQREIAYAI